MGGLLQDGEQQLQMFLTKLGAEERKNINGEPTVCVLRSEEKSLQS